MSRSATLELESTGRYAVPGRLRARGPSMNVGVVERLVSTVAGGLLVSWELRRRSPASLLGAFGRRGPHIPGVAGHCACYRVMGINTAAARKSGSQIRADAPGVPRSITIGRSAQALYDFWHDPVKLARITSHFAEVTPGADGLTHCRARDPMEQILEWDSRYIAEQPGRRLAWQTIPGGTMASSREVTFTEAPNGSGTEIHLHLQFEPPLGEMGAGIARALHKVPRSIAGQTLRRFKSLAETGEIPTLEHNPSGRGTADRF